LGIRDEEQIVTQIEREQKANRKSSTKARKLIEIFQNKMLVAISSHGA